MFVELAQDNLQEQIQGDKTVFVQYSAGWCGNCRLMKPKFKRFAGEVESADFIMVDAENNPNSRQLAEVTNLPTFAAFRGGKLIKQIQTNKADNLKEFIDEVTSN